jgi:16S rRNA (guanine1516-N2)-methyltransferase
VGADEDAAELVEVARQVARDRVVVKRPLKAPDLAPGASHRFTGTSIRYDLYMPRKI